MPNDTPHSFGKKLKELRDAKGQLLRKAAANLDIDSSVLSKLENGLLFPNDTLLQRIAKYYKIHPDELRILLYADKIINDYGDYRYARDVINLVGERLSEYSIINENED
jgi:transcriptional regulator with XRE-family HTH domain